MLVVVVVGGGELFVVVGGGELGGGLLLVLGDEVDGELGLAGVDGEACVVAGVTGAAAVCDFALWWAFFLCVSFLALCAVVAVLVVSAVRCCLALWVLEDPPHPATATAAAIIVTSARFITPLWSLKDSYSGSAILQQMLRGLFSVSPPRSGQSTLRLPLRLHLGHLGGAARGRLSAAMVQLVDLQLKGRVHAAA